MPEATARISPIYLQGESEVVATHIPCPEARSKSVMSDSTSLKKRE